MTRLASLLHCTDNAKPRIALTVDMGTIGCLSENSAAVRQFIQWVGEHHLNTTWVVDQARQLSWVATLQDRTTRHEVALNFNWATPELSRSQFQEELDKRWDACKQVAIQPTTAYSRDPESLRTRLSQLAPRGLTTWITDLPQRTKSGRLHPSFSTCVPRPLPRGDHRSHHRTAPASPTHLHPLPERANRRAGREARRDSHRRPQPVLSVKLRHRGQRDRHPAEQDARGRRRRHNRFAPLLRGPLPTGDQYVRPRLLETASQPGCGH